MIYRECLHLLEGTEHVNDSTAPAENRAVLHHEA